MPVTKYNRCGEGKVGKGWQIAIEEMLLLYGRIFDLYRSGIYVILLEGKRNNTRDLSALKEIDHE